MFLSRKLGFKSHGIVIRDDADKALWKQPDHLVNLDDVRKALKELLETPGTSPK